MDINEGQFKIVFTNDCRKEMEYIYNYISQKLYALKAAKNLMKKVEQTIQDLKFMPKAYTVIKKYPKLKMEYRRISLKNYIIIYAISEEEKTIYIVHMFYGRNNYLEKL